MIDFRLVHPFGCLSVLLAGLLVTSCAPRLAIDIQNDGALDLTVSGELSERANQAFQNAAGGAAPLETLDTKECTRRLEAAGFTSVSTISTSARSLRFTARHLSPNTLFGQIYTVSLDQKKAEMKLDRHSLSQIIALMGSETMDYLDLLMAPALTGEILTQEEYTDQLASFWGKNLAMEMSTSNLILTLACPEPVQSARIEPSGTVETTGKTARFSIPLSAILIMDQPLRLSVQW